MTEIDNTRINGFPQYTIYETPPEEDLLPMSLEDLRRLKSEIYNSVRIYLISKLRIFIELHGTFISKDLSITSQFNDFSGKLQITYKNEIVFDNHTSFIHYKREFIREIEKLAEERLEENKKNQEKSNTLEKFKLISQILGYSK